MGDGAPVRALADDGVGCVSEADQISAAVRLVLLDEVAVLAEVAVTSDGYLKDAGRDAVH